MIAARREPALDSLRGIDVLLMILVNMQGNGDAAFPFMKHAEWNGLTLADCVFPVFLLIVGISASLALERPGAVIRWPTILRRVALLFAIGVGLSFAIRPSLDPNMIRLTGVLQRIAIVYLCCAGVVLIGRGVGHVVALSVALLVLHTALLLYAAPPGGGPPSLAPGMGISGWLDQNFIPGRVLRETWDPEGVLSTLPAIASGLIGVAAMRWVARRRPCPAILALCGFVLIAAGMALTPWVPLNKNLWTASFVLVTSGIGVAAWAGLRALWPFAGQTVLALWTVGLGRAALTLYVVHTLLIAIIVRKLPDGRRIWDVIWQAMANAGLGGGTGSMLYALAGAAVSCIMLVVLQRRGWILRV